MFACYYAGELERAWGDGGGGRDRDRERREKRRRGEGLKRQKGREGLYI